MSGSATWRAWVTMRGAAVLLGAGCVIWAALPPADKGYAGFAVTVAIAGVAGGGQRLALTAVPVPEDSYLLSAGPGAAPPARRWRPARPLPRAPAAPRRGT